MKTGMSPSAPINSSTKNTYILTTKVYVRQDKSIPTLKNSDLETVIGIWSQQWTALQSYEDVKKAHQTPLKGWCASVICSLPGSSNLFVPRI